MCNSASIGPTALKFGSYIAELSYHCTYRTENVSLIFYLQMKLALTHQSWKIGSVYKTPFHKFGHI